MLGEFVVGEPIGEGGQSVVYRARQPALARDVVIKVLRAQRQDSIIAHERFLREAQLASRLDHPYAAHVYACGVTDLGLPWIAMELVQGTTLSQWLATRCTMSLAQLVPFMERVAHVVHAAHQLGIVHRDLKPSNVMVIEQGDNMFPKLLDFGIAKMSLEHGPPDSAHHDARLAVHQMSLEHGPPDSAHHDARLAVHRTHPTRPEDFDRDEIRTQTNADAIDAPYAALTGAGTAIGSSPYMSPEQWQAAWSVGPTADIYALGIIIYRALAGRDPFIAENMSDYYQLHLHVQPPRLGGEMAPVDRVVQRALAKSASDRHATALELAADLRTALRASEREQLRIAAQQWDDRNRSPGLLWGREEVPYLERWSRGDPNELTPVECAFVETRTHLKNAAAR